MRKLRVFLLALLLFSGLAFGLEVRFFHDVSGGTPIESILQNSASWPKILSEKIFYPPNEGVLWQRVEPSNQGWDSLEIQYSSLDEALLYFIKDEKIIREKKAGLNHPFQSRDVGSIYPTFKLDDEKSYDFILVGVKTQAPMQAPIAFTNAKKVIKDHQNLLVFFGVFVGAMGVLAATSKIFASAIGNLGDVHYWLHILCTTVTVLCVYYIPTALFWVDSPSKWIAHLIMSVSQLYCLSVLAIFRDFIDSPQSIFKNEVFKWTTRALFGGMGLIALFTLHKAVISVCYIFVILTVLGISIYSFWRSKDNPRLIRFVAAESIVLFGMFLFVLNGLGFLGAVFYYAFAISICLEQAIFVNGLILRARQIQIEKTELLLSEIKARRDKEDANSKHISRLSLLLTLSRDLHMAKNAKDAMDIARKFTEKELGPDFDIHSFFFESPNDDVQIKADKIFAKHIFEQLNSAIDSIESNTRQIEIETTRLQEKYDLEKENLKNIVQISDQLNSPLMSLSMLIGKMLAFNTNDESIKDPLFEVWKKSRNIIESSLNLIIKASKNLSEMREKYANIEATSTFEGGDGNGR